MKLRIKGDSIRLRVSRSELARLQVGESLAESVHLAPGPAGVLQYVLAVDPQPPGVTFRDSRILVRISSVQLARWTREEEVGIYLSFAVDQTTLEVSIEKDFACADAPADANEDTFAHPAAGAIC